MANRPKNSIAQQLNACRVAVSNTLADAEIQAMVAAYGYTAQKMAEGQQIYDAALAAVNEQVAAAGAQRQATARLKTAEKEARDAYQSLAKVARAIFAGNPTRLSALGLTGVMPKDIAGFLAAGYTLFDNALTNEEIKTALLPYGYPEAKLQSEKARIAAYDGANQTQEAAKGAAQQATREQDARLKEMQEWLAQYIKIARVALRGKKQLLEKIGVPARTTRRKPAAAPPQS